ncbi:hypothetical protein [Burkholderia sp. Ax-1719]|nr:hypothetical protein [Burkholderia sp. Ax-1719]
MKESKTNRNPHQWKSTSKVLHATYLDQDKKGRSVGAPFTLLLSGNQFG